MSAADPFLDSGEALQMEVIDLVTDSEGRRWALVIERRFALVLVGDDDPQPGDEYALRLDMAGAP